MQTNNFPLAMPAAPKTASKPGPANTYSEELHEIVSAAPVRLIKWSTTIFLLVLLLLAAISFFVSYRDVLGGAFTLVAADAPKSVISKVDGKLQTLFVKENDTVRQGAILAYLECTASHGEVLRLAASLDTIWSNIQADQWHKLLNYPVAAYKGLGEIQAAYQVFIAAYLQLGAYLKDGMYAEKKKLLQHELDNLQILKGSLLEQERIYGRDYELALQEFKIKEQLYHEKVVPLVEYKQEESKCLSRRLPLENARVAIINNNSAIVNKKQELIALEQNFSSEKSSFLQALNTLASNIDEWKKKYLLCAPVAGKVTWPILLQEKQDVKVGQELFYISPPAAGYYGEIYVPQENFGKLKTGQPVLIMLSSFPYQEFGKLRGHVSFISDFPNKDKQYFVAVTLDNALQTDLHYTLGYRNGLTGHAEIITSKTRLINKLLFTIRKMAFSGKTNP